MRSLSHSEASLLYDCPAKHDFRYVGQLAGTPLESKEPPSPILGEGRAWGRAVNAFGIAVGAGIADGQAYDLALAEIRSCMGDDEYRIAVLGRALWHYISTGDPLARTAVEIALTVDVGEDEYLCYLDAFHEDQHGLWIVEDKWRYTLSSYEQVLLGRQVRWYAWAARECGREVTGYITEERLARAPEMPKVNKNGAPSTDKRQYTTPGWYLEVCEAAGAEPDYELLDALTARTWQARHRIFLSEREISEAGEQIASTLRLVKLYDAHEIGPVRNPHPSRCPSCEFRPICPNPDDDYIIESFYDRTVPKAERAHADLRRTGH